MMNLTPLAFFTMPQGAEWLVIMAFGLLIFGKRLPDVGKGIGQAIRNFKKGLNSPEDDVEQLDAQPAEAARQLDDEANKAAPRHKFDPYTGKPIEAEAGASPAS
jgi:TatA/E family protein of Tat protein translocase